LIIWDILTGIYNAISNSSREELVSFQLLPGGVGFFQLLPGGVGLQRHRGVDTPGIFWA
jgi:hypothetical protein